MRGTGIATTAHSGRNRDKAVGLYKPLIRHVSDGLPYRKHTDELLGDHIPPGILNACSVSGGGTMRGRGGPITAAVDGPGGPILAGDHRRRDMPVY